MKAHILLNYDLITQKCVPVFMNIVFLWALRFSAHPSLKCCSFGTSPLIIISNNTVTLYGRELLLNIRRMTVIGTYSSDFYILHFDVA